MRKTLILACLVLAAVASAAEPTKVLIAAPDRVPERGTARFADFSDAGRDAWDQAIDALLTNQADAVMTPLPGPLGTCDDPEDCAKSIKLVCRAVAGSDVVRRVEFDRDERKCDGTCGNYVTVVSVCAPKPPEE